MKTKTYYHSTIMENIPLIMKHGLIKNISDNGIYFTDDAVSSLDWIRCREELWFKRTHKSLGLIIFEVQEGDKFLEVKCDYNKKSHLHPYYPQKLKLAQQSECVIYKKSIPPFKLKFEECIIDNDDYECVELKNYYNYSPPTKKMRIDLMVKGFQNVLSFDDKLKSYIIKNPVKDLLNDPESAELYYDMCLLHQKKYA